MQPTKDSSLTNLARLPRPLEALSPSEGKIVASFSRFGSVSLRTFLRSLDRNCEGRLYFIHPLNLSVRSSAFLSLDLAYLSPT